MSGRDLPKGRSWPISRKKIEEAVTDAGLPELSWISQYVPYAPQYGMNRQQKISGGDLPEGWVLYVDWEPFSSTFPPWGGGSERVTLWMRDVASDERSDMAAAIQEHVLPELVTWLRAATSAPEGWKILRHRHAWAWIGGRFRGQDVERSLRIR